MSALDTNVLVRYLVKDDVVQGEAAAAYIHSHCTVESPAFINRIVLCELVWVLSGSYGYSREQIAATLEKILQTRQFTVENNEAAWLALSIYKQVNVDFADALIGVINRQAGHAGTATFDRQAGRLEEFNLLMENT